jgi:8-oxo-dGTP diphosphatase
MEKKQNNIPTSYLILEKEDKILLLRRFNTGYEDGNYSLIAGHVEADESFTQCAIREAKEEAGIILKPENLKVAHVMHRNSGLEKNNERIDVFFRATEWEGSIENIEPHKCDDLSWFHVEKLPSNIVPYVKQAIQNISNQENYSEHGWQ